MSRERHWHFRDPFRVPRYQNTAFSNLLNRKSSPKGRKTVREEKSLTFWPRIQGPKESPSPYPCREVSNQQMTPHSLAKQKNGDLADALPRASQEQWSEPPVVKVPLALLGARSALYVATGSLCTSSKVPSRREA